MSEVSTSNRRQQNLAARKVAITIEEEFLAASSATKTILDDINVGKTPESLTALRAALRDEKLLSDEYENIKSKVQGL